MSKCAVTLLAFLFSAVAASSGAGRAAAAPDDDDEEVSEDDDDDARPAKRKKPVKRTITTAADDDDDAAADADEDDEPRPAKRKKPAKRTITTADDDDDDDAAADDEDDEPRPAKRKKPAKRPAATDDDDDDEAADDDDEPRPAKRKKPAKRPAADDDDEADDEEDDDEATADADEDDDAPRKKRRNKRPTRDADEAVAAPAPADRSPTIIEEVYIIPPKVIVAAEVLGVMPMDSVNSDLFAMGGGGGIGVEYHLSPAFALHASASFLYLRAGEAMSTTSWASGQIGPRLHVGTRLFGATSRNDAWVDAHVSYGTSGGIRRPGFDVGLAIQWELSPAVRVGPMARWAFGSDPLDKNAQLLTVGLAVGIGGRSRSTVHIEGDADGDGLLDRLDACPTELPGDQPDPAQAGCPLRDADADGVLDDDDECAEEAAGDRPDPERAGCPLPLIQDQDGDSVVDDDDKCPDQPGAARPGEPTNGCPLARVQDQKIEILEQIFFEHDSATIIDGSRPVLEAIAKVIGSLDGARVSIEGHTDEVGTDAYNLDLSKRRARAVAQWLIEQGGVGATRLEVKAFGKRRPLVSGVGADTSKNRRVEFLILEEK